MAIITTYPDDTSTTDTDKFLTLDSSGATKLTPASNVNKYLGQGWTIAADTWTFSSYASGVGIINATSGANTRYQIGNWVKFTQPTLGTKYAKVIAITTSTITLQFQTGSQLDNEGISSPYYSVTYSPFGALTTNSVQASELSASAITLGYTQITANFTTSSTTPVQVTGLTSTVTVPTGGRRIKISLSGDSYTNLTAGAYAVLSIWDGTVGSGTKLAESSCQASSAAQVFPIGRIITVTPAAGSKTYNIGMQTVGGGTAQVTAATTSPALILVEAI